MHNPTDTGTNKRCPICDAWSCSCAKDPPTDAAAASLAGEFYRIMWPITHDPICDWSECSPDVAVVCKNLARHVLTRQPGPEDMDRIGTFAHAPTRSALDSAIDPMLGNTPVRRAVVGAVLGLFESARRPLTEADVVRIAESATNIRAARNGGYKMWTDLPDYIHAERAQFTRDILTAASWPMTAPTDSAASDRLEWLEKTHSETMDQNARLIVERNALNGHIAELEAAAINYTELYFTEKNGCEIANARVASLEAELAAAKYNIGDTTWWRHKKRGSVYMELCRAELQSSMPLTEGDTMVVYSGEDGKFWARPEDEFDDGRFECVGNSLTDPTGAVQVQAATPPLGTIRLGEGLTGAQEADLDAIIYYYISQGWPVYTQTERALKPTWSKALADAQAQSASRHRERVYAALRASATPKPEAVDWVKIARDYRPGGGGFSETRIINGLCEQIAALRAGGV